VVFYFGVDYYPEQWEHSRWTTDVQLMREARVNIVRLAEFAWSRLEPEHGQYQFAWLDEVINLLGENGIQVVLGTPTASPPPWVMERFPDAFIQWADGRVATYGSRREYCPNHRGYRELSRSITRSMAEHFQDNPHVIGWQTDNEFGDRCYCSHCQQAFQNWLKERFQTLEMVNQRWGAVFWSQEYSKWEQIPTPKKTGYIHNPGLELDYFRFMSESYIDFQNEQIAILRETCSEHFITHNLMGFSYNNLDYFAFSQPLDFVTWDNYPRGFWIQNQLVDAAALALGHDTMRGLKQKNFWVMEAHSGPAGWDIIGSTPRPNEIRLWAYQAIAHGADGIVFFRWRTARYGAEQYWHGVLDHDGKPRRRYAEFKQLGHELQQIGTRIQGSQPQADVAMLLSYDSRFAFQIQPNNESFSYPKHFLDYYRALYDRNITVNVVSPHDNYSAYRVLVVPALYVVTNELAQKLSDFVGNGGTLVLTARSGVKEESNAVVNLALPGLLRELCGIEIAEYDSLRNAETVGIKFQVTGNRVETSVWCDVLELQGAEAIAHYTDSYYADRPAISRHHYGKGQVIYVGTLGGNKIADAVIDRVLQEIHYSSPQATKTCVETRERYQSNEKLFFILNHSAEVQRVALTQTYDDLLSDKICEIELELQPYEVYILCSVKSGG
jgi:beta-galactosidase